jgi:hypothetical protein
MLTNLVVVGAAGLLAPLMLGFFPRVRLPAIVLGIVIGPSGLGWVKPDAPVSILALVGLAFLLFLSGLEIDVDRLRGRIVKITALAFAVSFVIAILIGTGFHAGGFVKSPLFVAIVLVATALGVIFPVLKDSGNIGSSLGEVVIAAASIADFGSIILLSLFFSGKGSTSMTGRLVLLGIFGLVVLLVGVAIASAERSLRLSRVLRRLQDTERLESLQEAGVLAETRGSHGYGEYVLTDKGLSLWPVVRDLLSWGDEYYSANGPRRVFQHAQDAGSIAPDGTCAACGSMVPPSDPLLLPGPGYGGEGDDFVSKTLTTAHRLLEPVRGQ